MKYTEIKVKCHVADLDQVSGIMSMIDSFLKIEDYSDFDSSAVGYDGLADASLLNADRTHAFVSLYIPEEEDVQASVDFLKQQFAAASLETELCESETENQDWENEWKKYYEPVFCGEHVVIVPSWQEYEAKKGEVIVKIDPGLAFGTGTHESTRLCLGLLEKYVQQGDSVLDVGTGSGILAVAAKKLGADRVYGLDIDPVAVRSAKENAALNETDIAFDTGSIEQTPTEEYRIIVANIVADVILALYADVAARLTKDGVFVASGIIKEREQEVTDTLLHGGFDLIESRHEGEWCALAFRKKND
ncbi:MAG: 50S ribosomal protein L11 methyltransferase [Clostridiales bacterium]|nr:50S ribosomal protein L11 methyltransferase [Clostridiales bacterium]